MINTLRDDVRSIRASISA